MAQGSPPGPAPRRQAELLGTPLRERASAQMHLLAAAVGAPPAVTAAHSIPARRGEVGRPGVVDRRGALKQRQVGPRWHIGRPCCAAYWAPCSTRWPRSGAAQAALGCRGHSSTAAPGCRWPGRRRPKVTTCRVPPAEATLEGVARDAGAIVGVGGDKAQVQERRDAGLQGSSKRRGRRMGGAGVRLPCGPWKLLYRP